MSIEHSKEVADELAKLLAESYTLYLKTHKYHWNVVGPMFHSLHLLFETQYTELATAVDDIAERIRALGHKAPGSYGEFAKLSSVKDAEGDPDAEGMVKELADDHRTVAERANKIMGLAGKHDDEGTAALASARIEVHEKAVWMLSAHLG
ncbi:MAG: Dps family protein [Halofilum sp. (in: g-proteobacteria)]